MSIYYLDNTIQNYTWGSSNSLTNLFGYPVSNNKLEAELWIGSHPKSPSNVIINGYKYSILKFIKKDPINILGKEIFKKFGYELPYLFKVLTVNRPLSIQVHPCEEESKIGYIEENLQGIKIDDYERNYKDLNCKIEFMYALTPLKCLIGFRNIIEMQLLMNLVSTNPVTDILRKFKEEPNKHGLEIFFRTLKTLPKRIIKLIVSKGLLIAERLRYKALTFDWICNLANIYPNDICMFAPLVFNLVVLEPGQAIFVHTGVPHVYIEGIGVELMSNSDNVLRVGLTKKHVDISKFFGGVNFLKEPVKFITSQIVSGCERQYKTGIDKYFLSVIQIYHGKIYNKKKNKKCIEILLCICGKGLIIEKTSKKKMNFKKGDSVLITASVEYYSIYGNLTIFKIGTHV